MNIFVGNLPDELTPDQLREVFEIYGDVASARVASDPETGRARGYGFVEMPDPVQAEAALSSLNLKKMWGRVLIATHARASLTRGRGGGDDRRPTHLLGRRG